MDASRRTLLQVTVEQVAIADEVVSRLMGDDVDGRKHFIQTEREGRPLPRHLRNTTMSDTTPPSDDGETPDEPIVDDATILGYGSIEPIEIQEEMERSFLDYSMSVIVSRALPDVRDGLKPVHRRILWGMHDIGARPDRPVMKCARVTGDVMGKYHPHGDGAIYDALVRMAQDFSLRHPLVDAHGNFGSPGLRPAADALHRVPAGPAGHAHARRHRRGHRRLQRQLLGRVQEPSGPAQPLPEPAGQRQPGHRGRHGHQHPAAQPRRDHRRHPAPDRPPRGHPRRPHAVRPGPGLPDRRADHGQGRDHGRLPHRPGLDPHAGGGRDRGVHQGRRPDRRHRAALPGRPEQRPHQDRRAGRRPRARRRVRRQRGVGRRRDPHRHHAQARRAGAGHPQQPLQAHAAADHLRGQHRGAGRRRAPHAQPPAGADALHRPPGRRHHPPVRVPPAPRPASGPTSSRACSRRST